MPRKSVSMVDVTPKPEVHREAVASGTIRLKPRTVSLIRSGGVEKGNPIEAARLAGIMAAKATSRLLPLCHPLPLTHVEVDVRVQAGFQVKAVARVKAQAKTGVEMEALMAVSVALLTVWDMVKQYEKDEEGQYPQTAISNIVVERKVKTP